eukprot:3277797-Alexandrium_andersonii.AAC.1
MNCSDRAFGSPTCSSPVARLLQLCSLSSLKLDVAGAAEELSRRKNAQAGASRAQTRPARTDYA